MHSVYLTPDHEEFRRQVRRFMEQEVAPQAEAWEAAGAIPREIFRRMGELGLLGILFPEEYGGSAGDIFFAMVFLEELPRSRMGGFCAAVSVQQFMATAHIYKHGSEELKQRYLAPSIRGEKVGALAITEPDTGSDVAAIRTKAVRQGDHWLINGAKTFITNGADGHFYTLACKTQPQAGAAGISLIVVDRDAPGVSVARRLKKMGWYSSDTAELAFTDVEVPAGRLVGQENMGFYYIMDAFALERLSGAAMAAGSVQLCLEETLAYMRSRTAFGRPLTKFQVLTHRLADMATELEAARQLTYHAAWLMAQGHACTSECSMAKLYTSELAKRVTDACLQAFGGFGFMEEYPMARFNRDARVGTIVGGTSEIMREIIGRLMIGESQPTPPEQRQGQAAGGGAAALMRSLPGLFRSQAVPGWSAVFHFALAGAEPDQWTLSMRDGACTVAEGLSGQADCRVEMSADTLEGLAAGSLDPQAAFMAGKVKVSDLSQMLNYLKAFRLGGGK
ncbi:MAG: acyl-CoA dehydrogenase family protein [Thermodesulfobacteriota bacterium]